MLQVRSFEFNPLQENTYVLYDENLECVIVDPGCYDQAEKDELVSFITAESLNVRMVLNTHCHVDHVLGNWFIKNKYQVPLLIHEKDEVVLRAVKAYAPSYGIFDYHDTEPDGYLRETESLDFGNQKMKILFVPGHAPGHVAFYDETSRQLISGDVLFYNSIGRTDLPGGHHETLIRSIQTQLFTLPDDVIVYPGHGPSTTIGYEKRTNPFCRLA